MQKLFLDYNIEFTENYSNPHNRFDKRFLLLFFFRFIWHIAKSFQTIITKVIWLLVIHIYMLIGQFNNSDTYFFITPK